MTESHVHKSAIDTDIVCDLRTSQASAERELTFRKEWGSIFPMDDNDQDIARRLIALRKRLGFEKQSDFAKEIGLEKSSYNPFETGERPLTLNAARRIRRRFGISVDWLLFGDLGQPSQNIAIELGPNPGAIQSTSKPAKRRRTG